MTAKLHKVTMSDEERSYLKNIVSKGRMVAYIKTTGPDSVEIRPERGRPGLERQKNKRSLDVSIPTIERLRKTFVLEGLEATLSLKKQIRPSNLKFDGKKEARLIALRCSPPPDGRERWTLQLLADKLVELEIFENISHEAVRERLKKMNLSLG